MNGRAWVLNLDAEREFATRGVYRPSRSTLRAVATNVPRIAGELLHVEDVLLADSAGGASMRAAGKVGMAWCPTPWALARLESAGAELPAAPDMRVLRRVNAKDFVCEIESAPALERVLARDLEQARRILARPTTVDSEGESDWLVRRRFGAAGLGNRRMRPPLEAFDLDWLARGLGLGPLTCEPFVQVTREFSLHGRLTVSGAVEFGEPCAQQTSPKGAWQGTRPVHAGELREGERQALLLAAERTVQALARAGYFGPFGLDALRFERDGRPFFQPLSDLNARYTMGWWVGMGARASRVDLLGRGRP